VRLPKKAIPIIATLATSGFAGRASAAHGEGRRSFVPPGYACAWHDEFGGPEGGSQPASEVDETSWTFQELDVNNEAQVYTTRQCRSDRRWNTCVRNGLLSLRALNEPIDCSLHGAGCAPHFGQKFHASGRYTSARLMTKHKVHFADGYLEFRLKLPEADRAGAPESGLWPAVWLLGENIDEGPSPGDVKWPACGEVDIMEWSTARGESHQGWNALWLGPGGTNACSAWPQGGNPACGPCPSVGGECIGSVTVDARHQMTGWRGFDHHGWHTYGLLWENQGPDAVGRMVFFIDGVKMGILHLGPEQRAFKHDMFLTINLALGGTLGGPVQIADWDRAVLDVDYVRWYRKGARDACGLGAAEMKPKERW
jgi:hypothetical protein